jgi:hypothetical protein
MNFMEAEFAILDKDKSRDLDAKDLQQQSTLHVSICTSAGKERLRAQRARAGTPITKRTAARSLGLASLCSFAGKVVQLSNASTHVELRSCKALMDLRVTTTSERLRF